MVVLFQYFKDTYQKLGLTHLCLVLFLTVYSLFGGYLFMTLENRPFYDPKSGLLLTTPKSADLDTNSLRLEFESNYLVRVSDLLD